MPVKSLMWAGNSFAYEAPVHLVKPSLSKRNALQCSNLVSQASKVTGGRLA